MRHTVCGLVDGNSDKIDQSNGQFRRCRRAEKYDDCRGVYEILIAFHLSEWASDIAIHNVHLDMLAFTSKTSLRLMALLLTTNKKMYTKHKFDEI